MMNRKVMVTGFLVLCLIMVMFMAGCTSQSQGNAPSQATGQQPAVTTPQATGQGTPQVTSPAAEVTPAVSDQGLVSDEGSDAVAQAEALNATLASPPAPDSTDFGDIMP